jgi:hypothetical protein
MANEDLWAAVDKRLDDIRAASRELDQYVRGWTAVNIPEYEEVDLGGATEAARSDELRAAIEQSKAAAQTGVEGARLEAEQLRAQRELGFKALEGQRSIATQLTASALQGINFSASLGVKPA